MTSRPGTGALAGPRQSFARLRHAGVARASGDLLTTPVRPAYLVLNAEKTEGLSQNVERTVGQNQGHDIASPKPEVEHAKSKPACSGHECAVPALVISVAISEEDR